MTKMAVQIPKTGTMTTTLLLISRTIARREQSVLTSMISMQMVVQISRMMTLMVMVYPIKKKTILEQTREIQIRMVMATRTASMLSHSIQRSGSIPMAMVAVTTPMNSHSMLRNASIPMRMVLVTTVMHSLQMKMNGQISMLMESVITAMTVQMSLVVP